MSLASTYAATIATAQTSLPTPFVGPGGLITATVAENGNCAITLNNTQTFTVPPAMVLAFATWVTTTFT
jgi:purine-cytosine permease-like protein